MTNEGLSPNDPSSYSYPEDCQVTQIDLDLNVDFTTHVLSGFAHLTVEKQKDGVDTVILDSNSLTIKSITDQATGQQLTYSLGDHLETFGSRLEVRLPNQKSTISIEYETSPQASAIQWLRAGQTAGKRQPYLFSQCQAIHCRSILPCQDTSDVKFPYTAKITAPKEIVILMSAISVGSEPDTNDSNKTVYRFEQKVPIPSYLIAIVGGDLESRVIGPRSKVWSEKEYVDAAAYEFSETETMLKIAEDLCGPYVWGRYDLLAGDKSLADVVAHEIAHSWTGNLVTNRNPEHFWLNEGHTVFLEGKIRGRMFGEPCRQLMALEGWKELNETVNVLRNGPYTKLIPDLRGVNPDDAYSIVPYYKGFSLLYHLETLLGGPSEFEPFLRAYIDKFKYKSIDSKDWKEFLYSFFHSKNFLCSVCGILFKRRASGIQHENRHLKIGPYTCKECEMVFFSKANFNRHNIRHSYKHKYYRCKCGKKFKMKIDLERHRKKESRDFKFKCPECKNVYESAGALNDHIRSHDQNAMGVHICDICKKTFKHKTNLYRHRKIHDSNTFTCVECSKNFTTRRYLFDHLKTHEPSDNKKCMICFKLYKNRKCLLQHMKNVHK